MAAMTSPLTCPDCGANVRIKPDMVLGGFVAKCQKCGKHGNVYATIDNARKSWVAMGKKEGRQ